MVRILFLHRNYNVWVTGVLQNKFQNKWNFILYCYPQQFCIFFFLQKDNLAKNSLRLVSEMSFTVFSTSEQGTRILGSTVGCWMFFPSDVLLLKGQESGKAVRIFPSYDIHPLVLHPCFSS